MRRCKADPQFWPVQFSLFFFSFFFLDFDCRRNKVCGVRVISCRSVSLPVSSEWSWRLLILIKRIHFLLIGWLLLLLHWSFRWILFFSLSPSLPPCRSAFELLRSALLMLEMRTLPEQFLWLAKEPRNPSPFDVADVPFALVAHHSQPAENAKQKKKKKNKRRNRKRERKLKEQDGQQQRRSINLFTSLCPHAPSLPLRRPARSFFISSSSSSSSSSWPWRLSKRNWPS